MCEKYEQLMDTAEEKQKELRHANRDLKNLRDRLVQLENQLCELSTEVSYDIRDALKDRSGDVLFIISQRNLLREEVIALKEKEAENNGRERALNDQLKSRHQEIEKARCLLREMQQHLHNEERQHKETVDRLCRANEEIRLQMHAVAGECKQMQLKLKYVCGEVDPSGVFTYHVSLIVASPFSLPLQTAGGCKRAANPDYRIVSEVEGCAT